MKAIPLTTGGVAFVDDSDFDAVNAFKWRASKIRRRVYAARSIPTGRRGAPTQYLHQFLMPWVPQIDHRDGDGLNCQRHNLRPATRRQNQRGFQRKKLGATSQFRGVSFSRRLSKWVSQIKLADKVKHLGYFNYETEAARAYDAAAREHFGEFASPNFP